MLETLVNDRLYKGVMTYLDEDCILKDTIMGYVVMNNIPALVKDIGPQDNHSFNSKYPEFWEDWSNFDTYWYAG